MCIRDRYRTYTAVFLSKRMGNQLSVLKNQLLIDHWKIFFFLRFPIFDTVSVRTLPAGVVASTWVITSYLFTQIISENWGNLKDEEGPCGPTTAFDFLSSAPRTQSNHKCFEYQQIQQCYLCLPTHFHVQMVFMFKWYCLLESLEGLYSFTVSLVVVLIEIWLLCPF